MQRFHRSFRALGSPCSVQVIGEDRAQADVALAAVAQECARIEALWSRYRNDSVVSRINAAAGGDWVAIDPETHQLLQQCAHWNVISEGRFDITSGVLRAAWRFPTSTEAPTFQPPDAATLAPLLGRIDGRAVELQAGAARLARAGMEIDLGGIGKEYAVDRCMSILTEQGVTSALVNLGGDLRVQGHKEDGSPWRLGIQHPRRPDTLLAEVPLAAGALATSGDYERFFIDAAGRRHWHILDPRTGYSPQRWQAISVIAPTAVLAGGLSTIAMLYEHEALSWLNRWGVDYLAVDAHGTLHTRPSDAARRFPS